MNAIPSADGRGEKSRLCLDALGRFFSARGVLEWGVAPALPTPNAANLRSWIGKGRHGTMGYMAARLAERADPKTFHPWAESAVMFAFPYGNPLGKTGGAYRVAAYARCEDYHGVARRLLRGAEAALREVPGCADIRFYGFADTAPVFERDLASEAGLGWRGKNCCTLNRSHGSAFHLGGFFVDAPLERSQPVEDFCGGCTRCLEACPTHAFTGPGELDAAKCISYWTIEAKGEIPANLSKDFGGWIFGCDVCQEVCPWNHKPMRQAEALAAPEPALWPVDGPAWLALLRQGGGFQSRFKASPLTRAGRKALLRNLAVAARNLQDTSLLAPLRETLAGETDPALKRELERSVAHLEGLSSPPV